MGNLGELLVEQGRTEEGERLLHASIESGAPSTAAWGNLRLGKLCESRGDLAGAVERYRRAASSGQEKVVNEARERLQRLAPR